MKATVERCIAEYVINKNEDLNTIPFEELINKINYEPETGI